MKPETPLPLKVQALLDRERSLVRMPSAQRAEVWNRLEAVLPVLSPSAAPRPRVGRWLKALASGKLAIGLAGFLAGGGAGLALHDSLMSARPLPARPLRDAKPAAPITEVPPPPPVSVPALAPAAASTPAPAASPKAPPTVKHAPTRESVPPTTPDLAGERTRLEIARTAVARGDGEAALAAIARYRSEFPNGSLTEESEVLRIQALLAANRREAARAATQEFEARYPKSLALPALKASFRDEP